jgi:hypothetical protein
MQKLTMIIVFLSLFSLIDQNPLSAQDTKQTKQQKKEAKIKEMVESQSYSFEAQSAMPLGMRTRQLSYGYELKVKKDTIDANLPYFGRVYSATPGSSDGGIKFTTMDFTCKTEPAKKDGWNITINLKNAGDTRQMMLYISSAGYSTLQVISNSKQSISFSGYIQ